MTISKTSILKDLLVLIDFSCERPSQLHLFKVFHKMLIRMSYKAVDVDIDYDRKRVFMNVLAEDESYDLVPLNFFAETMSVDLNYTDVRTFLKSCILEDEEILKQYYPFLISSFYKISSKKAQVFETA